MATENESEWTDADFVPREPESASEPEGRQVERQRMEWLRREIRSRLSAGEPEPQIAGWLTSQGCDPGEALRLISWARTAAPEGGTVVVGVEQHYESGEVNADPIASARERAAARRKRQQQSGEAPPAEEYDFAQPSDASKARLNKKASAAHVVILWLVVGLAVVCIIVAALAVWKD